MRRSGIPAPIAPLLDERVDRSFVADAVGQVAAREPVVTRERLRLIVSCCDLTTLEPGDTPEKVDGLARRALRPVPGDPQCPPVAAVCVLPHLVGAALSVLEGSSVVVACATADFPAGAARAVVKQAQIRAARGAGAQEIDAVANRALLDEPGSFLDEVRGLKGAAGDAPLKVILETGELDDLDRIRRAAILAAWAGADTIKTSTGKTAVGATPEAAFVMARALSEIKRVTGRAVGIKVAGGIRTAADAGRYVEIVDGTLGAQWLRPELFRIGASSLLDDVADRIYRL